MNYERLYNSIISKAQSRVKLDCYVESHHIIPRALGGTDTKENLVDLTAREHCLAHLLLAKIHGGNMWHAANMMTNRFSMTSKAYAIIKEKNAAVISETMKVRMIGNTNGKSNLGKRRTEEVKLKMSQLKMGHSYNLGSTWSEEAKLRKSVATKGMFAGNKNPMFGTTGELSPSFKGTIIATCIKTGNTLKINGLADATEKGFCHSHMLKCVSGKRKSHKGHTFKRLEV